MLVNFTQLIELTGLRTQMYCLFGLNRKQEAISPDFSNNANISNYHDIFLNAEKTYGSENTDFSKKKLKKDFYCENLKLFLKTMPAEYHLSNPKFKNKKYLRSKCSNCNKTLENEPLLRFLLCENELSKKSLKEFYFKNDSYLGDPNVIMKKFHVSRPCGNIDAVVQRFKVDITERGKVESVNFASWVSFYRIADSFLFSYVYYKDYPENIKKMNTFSAEYELYSHAKIEAAVACAYEKYLKNRCGNEGTLDTYFYENNMKLCEMMKLSIDNSYQVQELCQNNLCEQKNKLYDFAEYDDSEELYSLDDYEISKKK